MSTVDTSDQAEEPVREYVKNGVTYTRLFREDASHPATLKLFDSDPELEAWKDSDGGLAFVSEVVGNHYYYRISDWLDQYRAAVADFRRSRLRNLEYRDGAVPYGKLAHFAAYEVLRNAEPDLFKTKEEIADEADKAYAQSLKRKKEGEHAGAGGGHSSAGEAGDGPASSDGTEGIRGSAEAQPGEAVQGCGADYGDLSPEEPGADAVGADDSRIERAKQIRTNAPQLRDYQQRGIDALARQIRDGARRILLVGPTGMGKMVTAAYIMHGCVAKGNPTMFIADQRELVDQCHDKLRKFGVECSVIMANSDMYNEDALAYLASKDTLHARAVRGDRISIPKVKTVIGDEAHKSLAPTWVEILNRCVADGAISIGMTATPVRLDGRGLGDNYDVLIQIATYKELRDAGWIVPCKVYAPSQPDLRGVNVARGDYVRAQLEKKMDTQKLVGDVIADWRRRADGRLTFCFASGVQHSVHLRNQFRRHGISAEHIDSKNVSQQERDDIMLRFKRGEVTVLCNYGIATTGVDVPEASCVISCRPTKSFSLWRQMCGRGLRSAPGKSDLVVLDHSGAVFVHGFPDEDVEWELSTTETIHNKIKKKREQEKREGKEPYECPGCKAVFRGPECPECGHKKQIRAKSVEMEKGELKEVERAKANRSATTEQKLKDWKNFVGVCMSKNSPKKMKAAAAMYKAKYGVFPPPGFDLMPKGGRQWDMDAREFYQAYQDHKVLGR